MWKSILSLAAAACLVGGCTHERHVEIPSSAMMVNEGDKNLSYMAPGPGTIYVYDTVHDRMIYTATVMRGQTVDVSVEKDKVTVDGKTVFEKGLHKGEPHRIFFSPSM